MLAGRLSEDQQPRDGQRMTVLLTVLLDDTTVLCRHCGSMNRGLSGLDGSVERASFCRGLLLRLVRQTLVGRFHYALFVQSFIEFLNEA
jgi:hypothetical protein